ncbi:MAG: M48 family metalloprotease [Chthoniobacter sp.]|uniref:M48 family metalloprotease n=1 Tax=Chthoniobacter sp. TaxID=2510640 RepID=UPI0032A829D6
MNSPDAKPFAASTPSLAYRAGLFFVVLGMFILPVIYLALTALACWWVWFFATHYFLEVWQWPIGHSHYVLLFKFVCSFTPLLVGAAIALAMVKPLFARRAPRMQPLALQPEVEPRVYALVQEICRLVGAPAPRRIELDCNLNASASFRRGLLSFLGHDLILTLGLPLIAGLSERELAGVIAHEFGHFRQGAGMRFSYLIRCINHWFARVVYERDAWDAEIASFGSGDSFWIGLMGGCVRAGVGLSRGILWLLMMTGHALSGLLLRQMEFDADRWEMRIAGSAGFESTMFRLATLDYVLTDIRNEMRRTWRRQMQLPDNLPVLVEYRTNHLPAERRTKVEYELGLAHTGWLDTHPSAADRIRQARRGAEPGVFTSDAPARQLFENFDTISRLVTLAHYEDDLNVPTTADFLIPLEALIKEGGTQPKPPLQPAAQPAIPMMAYDPSKFRKPESNS